MAGEGELIRGVPLLADDAVAAGLRVRAGSGKIVERWSDRRRHRCAPESLGEQTDGLSVD